MPKLVAFMPRLVPMVDMLLLPNPMLDEPNAPDAPEPPLKLELMPVPVLRPVDEPSPPLKLDELPRLLDVREPPKLLDEPNPVVELEVLRLPVDDPKPPDDEPP